jgi:hypothetical protein
MRFRHFSWPKPELYSYCASRSQNPNTEHPGLGGAARRSLRLRAPPIHRVGRPTPEDTTAWTVTDDWSEEVPITEAEKRSKPGSATCSMRYSQRATDLAGVVVTASIRAAILLRVSIGRQAEHDPRFPTSAARPTEAAPQTVGISCSRLCRAPARPPPTFAMRLDVARAKTLAQARPDMRTPTRPRGGCSLRRICARLLNLTAHWSTECRSPMHIRSETRR